jgi:hypothetical protein
MTELAFSGRMSLLKLSRALVQISGAQMSGGRVCVRPQRPVPYRAGALARRLDPFGHAVCLPRARSATLCSRS